MAILTFQRPDKVFMLEADSHYGKFEFRPLEPGYGITIGNSLRRILLSSLEGFAITSIRIDGIDHEFSPIPGVIEDVTRIILNLKKVRFKQVIKTIESEKAIINISGVEKFVAGDIGKQLGGFTILNPELVICNLDKGASFNIELTVEKGRGYVPAEENRSETDLANQIAIDSIFTPIRNVKYTIENFRVEQKTDYEKLILEITTDGSVHPKDALKEAARILIHHFM
ncbi:MAG: DNA-directed RNA polymerase subunit alpha, partial [Candidatus Azobacteroides sp.]|nr:DNA-directed RNA polymerase subunit alpha [Candidatus Azobacteroides sp.]